MIPKEADCATLLLRLKEGSDEAFKEVFYAFYDPLCVFSVQFTESLEQSEDIVQELFVNLWDRKLYQHIGNLRFYLFTSVRNRSIAVARRNDRNISFDEVEENAESAFYGEYTEEELSLKHQRLQASLAQLPPQELKVLTEIILNSKPYKQVAEEMGLSVNTVKTHMSRAMKALRRKGTLSLLPFV